MKFFDTIYRKTDRKSDVSINPVVQPPVNFSKENKKNNSWKYFYKSIELILTFWIVTVVAITTQPWLDYWVKTMIKKDSPTWVLSESTVKKPSLINTPQNFKQPTFNLKNSAIDIQAPIVEGTDKESLKNGIGHHPDSVWPNTKGNVVLAGHNFDLDSENNYGQIFMELRKVDIGNQVTIEYQDKKYTYEVFKKETVKPDDTSLFFQSNEWLLTFYTCDPPYTDWKRLVFQAKLVKIE